MKKIRTCLKRHRYKGGNSEFHLSLSKGPGAGLELGLDQAPKSCSWERIKVLTLFGTAKPREVRMRGSEGRSKATRHIITSASALQQVAATQQATHQACFLHMQDTQGRKIQCISPWKRKRSGEGVICSGLSHLLLNRDPDSPYGELTPLNF